MDTLWSQFAAPLRSFVAKRAPSGVDAEDVVQDVFVRIQEQLVNLRDADRIDAWIFQIARNVVADSFRKRARSEVLADSVVASDRVQSGLLVRKDAAGPVIARLLPGERGTWVATRGGWHQIELADGRMGFVSAAWSRVVPEPETAASTAHLHVERRGFGAAVAGVLQIESNGRPFPGLLRSRFLHRNQHADRQHAGSEQSGSEQAP